MTSSLKFHFNYSTFFQLVSLSSLSPVFETVRFTPLDTSPQVAVDNFSKLLSVQQFICNTEKMFDGVVQAITPVTQEIQAQFQTHTRVTLVISELDIGHNLSKNIKGSVLLSLALCFHDVLQYSLQAGRCLRNFPVTNLERNKLFVILA